MAFEGAGVRSRLPYAGGVFTATVSVIASGDSASYTGIADAMSGRRVHGCPVLDAGGRVIGVVSEAGLLLQGPRSAVR